MGRYRCDWSFHVPFPTYLRTGAVVKRNEQLLLRATDLFKEDASGTPPLEAEVEIEMEKSHRRRGFGREALEMVLCQLSIALPELEYAIAKVPIANAVARAFFGERWLWRGAHMYSSWPCRAAPTPRWRYCRQCAIATSAARVLYQCRRTDRSAPSDRGGTAAWRP